MRVPVEMRQVQFSEMRSCKDEGEKTETEADRETDQIEIRPGHRIRLPSPDALGGRLPSGCKASSRRSASPGVSRVAPNSRKHPRVRFSRAPVISTLLTSGSLARPSETGSS